MSLITSDRTNYDFTLEVPEIDAALLMELLEEEEGDHIGHETENCEDCKIDRGMMADFDNIHECLESSSMTCMLLPEDDLLFNWKEINEMGGEFIIGEDMGAYNGYNMEMRYEDDQVVDCDGFCYGDQSCVEQQLYIQLWQ